MREISKAFLEKIEQDFTVTDEMLREGMADFEREMERGLADPSASTLYMEPCYVALPTGEERGEAVALDFGGTNARASLVRLSPAGLETVRTVRRPLRGADYDVTTSETSRETLFDFLAAIVAEVLTKKEGQARLPLGHTFSFGTHQEALSDARLIVWSKEIAVPGVEGEMVNALLGEALARAGLAVTPTAILNDTVAVLLAAAFAQPGTAIGTIYATGFNSCYLETFGGARPAMVYNIESGSYGHFPQNTYDAALDASSAKPGAQRLEKMISGAYLGRLMGLVLADGLGLATPPALTAEDVSHFASGDFSSPAVAPSGGDVPQGQRGRKPLSDEQQASLHNFRPSPAVSPSGGDAPQGQRGREPLSDDQKEALQTIARLLIRRSARLAAMTLAAVLHHRAAADGETRIPPQTLAMDGSVFEKMPGIAPAMREALRALLGAAAERGLTFSLVKDASSQGAAIAAILAEK